MEMNFLNGNKIKTLLRFALPFLFANFLQALYGAVDLFVVGQFVGTSAVSAVSMGSQVLFTLTGFVAGLLTGGTVLLGYCLGKKNEDGARKAIGNMVLLVLILIVIFLPLMLLGTNLIVSLVQTPTEAVMEARRYIFICSCGIPAIIGYNAVSSIIRGTGDSKTPLFFVLIACVINIGLDFIFVKGLSMGVDGAAFATIISQFVSLIVGILYIKFHGLIVKFSFKDIKFDKYSFGQILKVGGPLAIQDSLVNISFVAITAIVNTMGLVASSGVGVVEKALSFAFIIPSSFSQALAVIVSTNLGAKLYKRANSFLWLSIACSFVFGLIMCLYCQFLPETIISIFDNNPEVIKMGSQYIMSYSIDCVLVSLVFNMNSYFSSYKKSMIAFIHSMIATFGIRIPLSLAFSKINPNSLYLLGFASPLATLFSCFFCVIVYLVLTKKQKDIIKKLEEKSE